MSRGCGEVRLRGDEIAGDRGAAAEVTAMCMCICMCMHLTLPLTLTLAKAHRAAARML